MKKLRVIIVSGMLACLCGSADAANGSVTLSIVDRLGRAIPSAFTLGDQEGKPVAGPGEAGTALSVPPGKWLLVPVANRRLAREITVGDGQDLPVSITQPEGVWLAFQSADGRPPRWAMIVPKSPAAMAVALAAFDLSRSFDLYGAAKRPGISAEGATAALALARAAYGRPLEDRTALGAARWGKAHHWAGRILAAIGGATDVERLTADPSPHVAFDDLLIAAHIEQRLGTIGHGRLIKVADGTPSDRAAAAAVLLHQAGVAHGDARLGDLLADSPPSDSHIWYRAWLAGLPLRSAKLDEAFAAETRRLLARETEMAALPSDQRASAKNIHKRMLLPLVIRALSAGNDRELEKLAGQPLAPELVPELAPFVANPDALARVAMISGDDADWTITTVASLCAVADLVPQSEGDRLMRELGSVVREAGQRAAARRTDLAPAVARDMPDNYVRRFVISASYCRPTAITAYNLIEDSFLPYTSWIPNRALRDEAIKFLLAPTESDPWTVLDRVDMLLETVPSDSIEAALGAKGESGNVYPYDMYRAYRRVATRANYLYPQEEEAGHLAAMRRTLWGRPYVIADKQYEGGVAGIASVRIEALDKATRLHVRLDQQAYYRSEGFVETRKDRGEWKFHPYTLDRGRRMISAVKLARGGDAISIKDLGLDADGNALFEGPRIDDWTGIALEVDLAIFEDRRQLLFELFASQPPGQ